ncbi:hypothetical protein A4S05_27615 [Nostoc sp. KVJ20]|nr:hypothetical protein A4S05_27615 [Nostoc sp. KVJ20]
MHGCIYFQSIVVDRFEIFWLYPNLLPIPTALVFIDTVSKLAVLPKFPNIFRWFFQYLKNQSLALTM